MPFASNLGFPRIGSHRELKRALEAYWAGKSDAAALHATSSELRLRHWRLQQAAGLDRIPSNDFSWYDHVLDTAVLVGAIPDRYEALRGDALTLYFAMARGRQDGVVDVPALEMTKWFDTNYHYIVPELSTSMPFALSSSKPVDEFLEAKAAGIHTRPVLLGPVSFLLLSKMAGGKQLTLLERLLPVYVEVLQRLKAAGADWVQIDEPCLVTDLSEEAQEAYRDAYDVLKRAGTPQLLLATYFGGLGDNLALAAGLPVAGLHVDLVRSPDQLDAVLEALPADRWLSAGLIDGRNVWRADLEAASTVLTKIVSRRGPERVLVAPSCSLLHVPVSVSGEEALDSEIRSWLAFAKEKLDEVVALAHPDSAAARALFAANRSALESRRHSSRVHDPAVAQRQREITEAGRRRNSPYSARRDAQRVLGLPPFPTTTIGSFPQTPEVRKARADFKAGRRSATDYEQFLRDEIERAVRRQEAIGLDVLVHGEFERNDMVEYFGEQLTGFVFTANGWVQSYGSRCVKPPIIYGDVSRPTPMTVEWSRYAQSLTERPMKGMLTGPVTILQWSFVRDDQPRSVTCDQIALAIRDEVVDLERAGLQIIQIDEPALREGLPLRQADRTAYLDWAVKAFRLATAGVSDATQIHTHMCYSEFNEIIEAVAAMDADVISMETSRSNMELLEAFAWFEYPNDIGPGVYDIHSPRVPKDDEMATLLRRAVEAIDPRQLWVNPDCGLKTRRWEEVIPALEGMVRAARKLRHELGMVP